jgi:oxygen-independent coproporphyrinogen III oxidase
MTPQTTDITVNGQSAPAEAAAGPTPTALTPLQALQTPPRSLYIHIPFCFHKCHYCDFYSFVDSRDRQEAFTNTLIRELDTLAEHTSRAADRSRPPLDTLFVGGGTPTLLRTPLWQRLLDALHQRFTITPDAEWTVECNPETATPELMETLAAGGVNRLSIGAQTFNPRHLKTLERWHDPASVPKALQIAREANINRLSLDLIFAIPGQTMDEWLADLRAAIDLGSGHISAYALTYEPNTAMTKRLERGDFDPADEDLEADMYEATVEALAASGFARYEVSNFARNDADGCPCAHNLAYWRNHQWLAAGPSASGHLAGWRWKNIPNLTRWMHGVHSTGASPAIDLEPPDPRRALAERIMTGLRLTEGLEVAELQATATPLDAWPALERRAQLWTDRGLLTRTPTHWRLTNQGWLQADGIASDLMSTLDLEQPTDACH